MPGGDETMGISRRDFLRVSGVAGAAGLLKMTNIFSSPLGIIDLAFAESGNMTLAYISDAHLVVKSGYDKEHRFTRALKKAVLDVNAMNPQPEFVLFGGDLAQLGLAEELELGREILSDVKPKLFMMVGEHDWYYDMGKKWEELFGSSRYSFDHKGIHFVVLNSVIVEDYWTKTNMTPMERMLFMAQLDNPKGKPFTVGKEQREWFEKDLSRVPKEKPIVVFSHSPLYKYYKSWNFWTDDAESIQEILAPFENVTVIHGHTHQVLINRIGNITFYGMLSTAWPWPYAPKGLPELTRQMDRADPFNQFDGCGWGKADFTPEGKADKAYNLWDRESMLVLHKDVEAGTVPEQPDALHSGPSY
jgi:3',5'-cyclic AMP phosphodiesterase CpdA